MKKLILLILALVLCLAFTACEKKEEGPVSNIYLTAVSQRDAVIKSAGESFTFEVQAKDSYAAPAYSWYRCTSTGEPQGEKLGSSASYTVSGLDDSQAGNTYYYLCKANDGVKEASLIFRCTRETDKTQFLNNRLGTWTDLDTGKYVVIGKNEEGVNTLMFGVWGDADLHPEGPVSFMEPLGDADYKMAADMPAVEDEGEHVGDDGEIVRDDFFVLEFIVTDNPGGTLTFAGQGDAAEKNGTYTFDERYQLPDPIEIFMPLVETE